MTVMGCVTDKITKGYHVIVEERFSETGKRKKLTKIKTKQDKTNKRISTLYSHISHRKLARFTVGNINSLLLGEF